MFEELEKAIADLANVKAGWVTRRDGAEFLGEVTARSLATLQAHSEEPDVDVQSAVVKALGKAAAGLAGIKPMAEASGLSLAELVQACAKPGRREIRKEGEGFVIDVTLKNERHQTVFVDLLDPDSGPELIQVFTRCGKPTEDSYRWSLRANAKLSHGAMALRGKGEDEELVLLNSFIADEVSPVQMKAAIKELAFYGDWIEKKLTGLDDF